MSELDEAQLMKRWGLVLALVIAGFALVGALLCGINVATREVAPPVPQHERGPPQRP